MAVNKKYVKIAIASVAVAALVIGLSVGLTQSKKNRTASTASTTNPNWDATTHQQCVEGKSGKSVGLERRLVVPGTENYSAGISSGKPGQLRNDLVRDLQTAKAAKATGATGATKAAKATGATGATKAAKASLPVCPPKNSDICAGKAGKSGGVYDWSDLGDLKGDKVYACPVKKSGKSGKSGVPGAGKSLKTRQLQAPGASKSGKSTPGPTPAPTTCDGSICTCPFPKWKLDKTSLKCQRTVDCADDEKDYLADEYKTAALCCTGNGITDATQCTTRTYDVCEDCCDCESQPWVKFSGSGGSFGCARGCAFSCDAYELAVPWITVCQEFTTETECCGSVGCGEDYDYCDAPTMAPTTDPISSSPSSSPSASPSKIVTTSSPTNKLVPNTKAPTQTVPCICEAEPWIFNGSQCIRGCNACENGSVDVTRAKMTCSIYASQAQCCNVNFGGAKNCGTDTCTAGLETPPPTTPSPTTPSPTTPSPTTYLPTQGLETLPPTPSPTQGSTPTVSTEVTGPPTKADRSKELWN